jgi:hypothetical protein
VAAEAQAADLAEAVSADSSAARREGSLAAATVPDCIFGLISARSKVESREISKANAINAKVRGEAEPKTAALAARAHARGERCNQF